MSRYLPDDNLSYPVLIKIGIFSGSGFFLNHNAQGLYLVTARHVLFKQNNQKTDYDLLEGRAELTVYGKDLKISTPSLFELNLDVLRVDGNLKFNNSADVAIVKIAELSAENNGMQVATFIKGVIQKTKVDNPIVGVKEGNIKYYSDVLVSNEAMILGYPNSLGDTSSGQIDHSRPLLRKGIVAGRNDKTKTIVLDCPVYGGNSGGMAIEVEEMGLGQRTFKVIGVVAEFVPFFEQLVSKQYGTTNLNIENSGYAIVVPMDFVSALI